MSELDFRAHSWTSELQKLASIYSNHDLSPVLFLLIKVGYDVQQAANEGVGSYRAGGALARGLSSKHGTAPLCVSQLLLHLHILLPEQGQVLLQLGHLLCSALW